MNKEIRNGIINSVDRVINLQGLAEEVADHIILDSLDDVTVESLMEIKCRPEGGDREKTMTLAGAERILSAIEFYKAIKDFQDSINPKISENRKQSVIEKFLENTSEDHRRDLSERAACLRITDNVFQKDRPMSWSKIRKELKLATDPFHKVIRVSKEYQNAVNFRLTQRLGKGMFFKGDLDKLAGFEVSDEMKQKNEQNRPQKLS